MRSAGSIPPVKKTQKSRAAIDRYQTRHFFSRAHAREKLEGGGAVKQADIRNGLVRQLEQKGSKTPHFLSMVEDYMFLHGQVQKMKASIRKDGVEYEAVSAAGKTYVKENPAVKNIVLYNRQMLSILKELGLNTDGAEGNGEDDEL